MASVLRQLFIPSSREGASATARDHSHNPDASWRGLLKNSLRLNELDTLSAILFLLDSIALLRCFAEHNAGNCATTELPGAHAAETLHLRSQFSEYITETYETRPVPSNEQLEPSRDEAAPKAPFQLKMLHPPQCDNLYGLAKATVALDSNLAGFEEAIKRCCSDVIEWASQGDLISKLSQSPAQPDGLDTKSTETRDVDTAGLLENLLQHSDVPPVNKLLVATVTRALSERRFSATQTGDGARTQRKSSRLSFDTGVHRWILASLLQHYLGDTFGQTKLAEGVTIYARDPLDDAAIRACFSDDEQEPDTPASLQTGSTVSLSPSVSTYTEKLADTSAKRDEKLKWLFGEPVHTETVGRTTPLARLEPNFRSKAPAAIHTMVARSPVTYRPRQRRDLDEVEILSPAELREGVSFRRRSSVNPTSPLMPPHRRAWSAGSDYSIPRKAENSSLDERSRDSISREDTLSRQSGNGSPLEWTSGVPLTRSDSNETYDSHSRLLLQRSSRSDGPGPSRVPWNRLASGAVTVSDESGRRPDDLYHVDEHPSGRPFTNLFEARVSSESINSEPLLQPRELPPMKNSLTAEEKQILVRKNKKLRALFGEDMEEERTDMMTRGSIDLLGLRTSHANKAAIALSGILVQREELRSDVIDPEGHSHGLASLLAEQQSRLGDQVGDKTESSHLSRSSSSEAGDSDANVTFTPAEASALKAMQGVAAQDQRPLPEGVVPLSSTAMSFVSEDGSGSPVTIARRSSVATIEEARLARRRKLQKVQAFLGERVPPSALLARAASSDSMPGSSGHGHMGQRINIPILTKASDNIQRRLTKSKKSEKGGHSAEHGQQASTLRKRRKNAAKEHSSSHNSGLTEEDSTSRDWDYVEVAPQQREIISLIESGQECRSVDVEKSAEPAILAVRRARKLEKLFGSLPPTQLYNRHRKPAHLREDSTFPDNASISSKTSRSSLYLERIASLRVIAESRDPELISDFARIVLEEDGEEIAEAESLDAANTRINPDSKDIGSRSRSMSDTMDLEDLGPSAYPMRESSSEGASALKPARVSQETSHSHSGQSGTSEHDSRLRQGIFGESPSDFRTSQERTRGLFQTYQSNARGRESVLSGVTAQSSNGSAYAADSVEAPHRPHSRASYATSAAGTGTPRSSMESVRLQFRRAHKLAHVFGTTRGEVFNRVLDDIEADIAEAEDEELDDEEKQEIMESVAALRASL